MSLSVSDKNQTFQYGCLNPHYTDNRFRDPQTIFLEPGFKTERQFSAEMVKDASCDYSDRLRQWNGEKCDEAFQRVKAKGVPEKTPAFFEAYLQELMEDPDLQLVHIVAGVNVGNGYPYRVYG